MSRSHAQWRKSARSGGNGGDCVEVAVVAGRDAGVANKSDQPFVILVRDSKNPDGPPLTFTSAEWDAFLGGVRDGEFDTARLLTKLPATAG